jgi:hypothetical protein
MSDFHLESPKLGNKRSRNKPNLDKVQLSCTERFCPVCEIVKPVTAFTITHGKSIDGYCKTCRADKARVTRGGLGREILSAQGWLSYALTPEDEYVHTPSHEMPQVVELVYKAIEAGAKTYLDIVNVTGLKEDTVGDALAHLLLRTATVVTKIVGGTRYYYLNHKD